MRSAAETDSPGPYDTITAASEGAGEGRRRIRFAAAPGRQGKNPEQVITVALIGKPNSGKTSLFNALTGLRQKVANYPGVTVERREGTVHWKGYDFRIQDLPGTYSLNATSEDESLVRDLLLGLRQGEKRPDLLLLVVDAANPERCLFLASQVAELGLPVAIALTMNDEARSRGVELNVPALRAELGIPVVQVDAPHGDGLEDLKEALVSAHTKRSAASRWVPSGLLAEALDQLSAALEQSGVSGQAVSRQTALLLLGGGATNEFRPPQSLLRQVDHWQRRLDADLPDWRQAEAHWRYDWVRSLLDRVRSSKASMQARPMAQLDALLTHPVLGLLVFAVVMALVFQSVFSWAGPLMDLVDAGISWLGASVGKLLPDGPLRGLLVDGIIGGVGSVLIFLPQILVLFLFITILEDSGYMARAAFMMHKHMRRSGLHGRSFIPMLSGFACAIPAIMATRSIPGRRDRLVTMLAVPFISCSARLPVYALMIACFIPARTLFAGFTLQGAVLWSAYILSVLAAISTAYLLRRTVLRGPNSPFIMELPPYRMPNWRNVLFGMWERGRLFLTQAGTVILCLSIVLWFLANYPTQPQLGQRYALLRSEAGASIPAGAALEARLAELEHLESAERIQGSYAGQLGRLLEPAIRPLGFDWKIGIGLIASFAAREVLVSTLAIVYGVGGADESSASLQQQLLAARDAATGRPVFNVLVALNLMLFFILACQCISTVAVVKRETNSWKWPLFMVGYMTAVAYLVCLGFYQAAIRIWPGVV